MRKMHIARMAVDAFAEKVKEDIKKIEAIKKEVSKIVVGQDKVINSILRAIISDGHVLLEGVPGIAKTLIVRTISAVMGGDFNRIQFTPDLLPTDIIGVTTYDKEKGFFVVKGPIFTNFLLADEINRAPPKVQSALLECMQEKQATIGKETFKIPLPFFVLATQNPLESLGTYPLPDAQIDRFLFKINIRYPALDEEQMVLSKNMSINKFEKFNIKPVLTTDKILEFQNDAKQIYLDKKIERYIVQIVDATRNPDKYKIKLGKYIEWGASPRASIGIYIAAKAEALLSGKSFVIPHYVKEIAPDVLRHRIVLNYEGQSENVKTEDVIAEILAKVPVP